MERKQFNPKEENYETIKEPFSEAKGKYKVPPGYDKQKPENYSTVQSMKFEVGMVKHIYFKNNEPNIPRGLEGDRTKHVNNLDEIGEKLKLNPEAKLFFLGYTDKDGSTTFNEVLSEERVKNVISFLHDKYNIEMDRFLFEAKGKSEANLNKKDARDRRVTMMVVDINIK